MSAAIDAEVRPPSPIRIPRRNAPDGVVRSDGRVLARIMHVGGAPILVRAWSGPVGSIRLRAEALEPGRVEHPIDCLRPRPAREADLRIAIERLRFSLCLDDDLRPFFDSFRRDPLLGPLIARKPWIRPRRRIWPWEALCWAVTKQLIEADRACEIQRRIVRAWGPKVDGIGPRRLADVPSAAAIVGRSPAELVAMDLAEKRALAILRCAREIAAGRADLDSPAADARLGSIPEIGPWTVRCLGLDGRGDHDSLPAGDLGYLKLVGRLAGLGRRATIEEVEEFFAPYEPYRGLAGTFVLIGLHKALTAIPAQAAASRW